MRDKHIAILAVQEAHMDSKRQQEIEELFKKHLLIQASGDPDSPSRRGGVAIVLNREIINASETKFHHVVLG
jgi:hypothetical protein